MNKQRSGNVRLIDIANSVGVSMTTVDRVLNRRGGVRGDTAEKIERAIKDLGFVPNLAAKSLSRPQDLNFLFLIPGAPSGVTGYMMLLEEAIPVVAKRYLDFRVKITARRSQPFDDAALATAILQAADEFDGIAIVALDTEPVRSAVSLALKRGVTVVTIISDLEFGGRVPYVGVKNYAAGRCAGSLLSRFLPGVAAPAIAVVAGSPMYRAHQHREIGFRDSIRETRPDAELIAITDVRNDGNNSFQAIADLLRQRHDIRGIYNVAAGNRGIVRALRERSTAHAKPIFVAHELTLHSRLGVQDGLVDAIVAQDPHLLADTAVRHLLQMDQRQTGLADRNISIPAVYIKDNIF